MYGVKCFMAEGELKPEEQSRRRAHRAALLRCSASPSDSGGLSVYPPWLPECLSVYPTLAPRVPECVPHPGSQSA
ncbi:unnamed protein product [Arctogadus glacialis]